MNKQEAINLIKSLMTAYSVTVEDLSGEVVRNTPKVGIQATGPRVTESHVVSPKPATVTPATPAKPHSVWDEDDPVIDEATAQAIVDEAFPAPTLDDDKQ